MRSEGFYVKDFMSIPITPAGIEPATFRFVAQHLNHCATAVQTFKSYYINFFQLWAGKYVFFLSFTPKFRTFLSPSETIPETVKNAMVYELSIVIQCVMLQWLADHNDLVACSCILYLSKTVTACSNVCFSSMLQGIAIDQCPSKKL